MDLLKQSSMQQMLVYTVNIDSCLQRQELKSYYAFFIEFWLIFS